MNRILRMESCAGSSSMIEVVHNPENDKFGIYITDETGYTDLITLRRDQVEILLKTVSDYVKGKSKAWRPRIVVNPASEWGCDFCGSYKNYMGRPGGKYTIICASCGARGPICDSATSARATWEEGADDL